MDLCKSNSDYDIDPHLIMYLKLYGKNSISFSSVFDTQMQSYYLPGKGYIMYATHKYIKFMLGDPLCSEDDLEDVIKGFIKITHEKDEVIIGMQCSFNIAEIFYKYDYHANHIGVETLLFLDSFDTKGKGKSKVRRWINSAKKAGVTVKEEKLSDSVFKEKIESISKKWLDTKACKCEMNLLTRPLSFDEEPDLRFFCGYLDGKLIGFNTFEPIYDNNIITGYYANICRIDDEAPNGTLDYIMHIGREKFKEEGKKYFSFGLSPLADIKDVYGIHNPIITSLFEANYKYGNELYSFQGLDFHKKAYHDGKSSERVAKFLISRGTLPIHQIISTLGYIGIVPNESFMSSLKYIGETFAKSIVKENVNRIKVTENEIKNILSGLLKGLSPKEIADKFDNSLNFVENFAEHFTHFGKDKLPEFQENIYIQQNLEKATKLNMAIIENIIDHEPDISLVYNIGVNTIETGLYVVMTIEINGKTTIKKSNFLIASIKAKIKRKMPKVKSIFIETVPIGQFAHKVGLDNVKAENVSFKNL